MRRNWRSAAAVLGVLAAAALLIPNAVSAQKVDNPGSFSLNATGGRIVIGSKLNLDLKPSVVPQCSDGVDNDGDKAVDLADNGCAAGPAGQPASDDDNELVFGFQPKESVSITGTIAANGAVTIPTSGIFFPVYYVPLVHPFDGSTAIVQVKLDATAPATGTLNPSTGALDFNVKMRALITGDLWGNYLPNTCMIGTSANPISIDFTTGRVPAVGTNPGLNGLPYSTVDGSARVVNNTFVVPGATGCNVGWIDLNPTINEQMQLPSTKNSAILLGQTTPVLGAGITASITSSPTTGDAPWNVVFNSDGSYVKKGPATFNWDFGDGTTSTEANPSHTFTKVGLNSVILTVTDADGDTATASKVVTVTGETPPQNPPTAHISTDPASPSGQAPFTVGFDGSGSTVPNGGATYAWNFGDGSTATGATASHTYTSAGTYTASLKVTDANGLVSSKAVVINVTAAPSEPIVPVARIVTTPESPSGEAPLNVGFSGSTSTVQEGPGTYEWTFGDGATATGVNVEHVYLSPGTFEATLRVTDNNGDVDTASVSITVDEGSVGPGDPVLPVARVTTTPTTPAGQAPFNVAFSGSTSTVDEGPGTYSWTFGDGSNGTGVNTSHTYTNPGTYTATLTVTDTTGDVSSDSVTVTVSPKPADPVSDDTVSVSFSGSINYANSGSGLGNLNIARDDFGVASVTGSLEIPGSKGGTAKVTVNVQRLWIFPLWFGDVTVNDAGANVNVSTPIIGGIGGTNSPSSAGSTMSWFKLGDFPDFIQPYSLNWSVVDAD